jgi:hypothetical protein
VEYVGAVVGGDGAELARVVEGAVEVGYEIGGREGQANEDVAVGLLGFLAGGEEGNRNDK